MGHQWHGFSENSVQEITRAVTSEPGTPKWLGPKVFSSPEKDFRAHGYVLFLLPEDFTLRYARNSLCFGLAQRWERLLMYKTVRHRFLSSCRRVARVAGATDMLILPEGTILEDSVRGNVRFQEIKRRAVRQLGGLPDLDVSRFYAKEEIYGMSKDRVHYFLTSSCRQRPTNSHGLHRQPMR